VNFRTHLHHIEEWAVYETHDGATMIALCPTCHDAVHHGPLEISDETLSQWKGVPRLAAEQIRDHIYVEPGPPQLLLGTFKVTCPEGIKVLEFGESNRLAFSLEEGDVLLLNLSVAARDRAGSAESDSRTRDWIGSRHDPIRARPRPHPSHSAGVA